MVEVLIGFDAVKLTQFFINKNHIVRRIGSFIGFNHAKQATFAHTALTSKHHYQILAKAFFYFINLSLINKFSTNSAQILFILCKFSKILRIFIYTPQIPHTTASTGG